MTRRGLLQGLAAITTLRGAAPDPALRRAIEAVQAAIPTAEADPERPIFHFRPV